MILSASLFWVLRPREFCKLSILVVSPHLVLSLALTTLSHRIRLRTSSDAQLVNAAVIAPIHASPRRDALPNQECVLLDRQCSYLNFLQKLSYHPAKYCARLVQPKRHNPELSQSHFRLKSCQIPLFLLDMDLPISFQ